MGRLKAVIISCNIANRIRFLNARVARGCCQTPPGGTIISAVPRTPERLGKYELLALLASGGMAEIHLARQTGIGGFERLVVVKRILPNLARQKKFVEMFFDEASIAAQLNHPNIVQIYEIGKEGDDYFIAMEYLEGESLGYLVRAARKRGKNLPAGLAAGIVMQVCDGLAFAHRFSDMSGRHLGIVHRDVSPQNIIVLFSGGVKLVDFGIAKAASKIHQTRVGTLKGKFSYMSPEQMLSKPVDARSDIFSLGVLLWELLARRRLFKREGEAATLQAVLNDHIPPLDEIRPGLPASLATVTSRALERDPEDRFQIAEDMSAAIREHLRASGTGAGMPEIAAFVEEVFGERARTKQRILQQLESAEKPSSLGALKPDTEESLPSRSKLQSESGQEPVATKSWFVGPPQAFVGTTGSRRRKMVAGLGVVCLAGIVVLAGWWLGAGRSAVGNVPGKKASVSHVTTIRSGGAPPPGAKQAEPKSRPAEIAVGDGLAQKPGGKAKEPKRPALLTITSRPAGCRATIDGVEVPGRTPLTDVGTEPGAEHLVAVTCGSQTSRPQRVVAGPREKRRLHFIVRQKAVPASAVKRKAFGFLKLNTTPWSKVYRGERKLGMTPLAGVRLPPGKHSLRAVNEAKGLSKTFSVTIQPGRTTKLKLRLDR